MKLSTKIILKVKKKLKTIKFYTYFIILLVMILLGGWCMPPEWFKNVLNEIKSKYTVEKILEKK